MRSRSPSCLVPAVRCCHNEAQIRAHVLLCRLALLLVRIAETATGNTWRSLRWETRVSSSCRIPADGIMKLRRQETLIKAGALQSAIFNSANFSSIATDAKGVIQIFNVGAERMLGYTAAEVMNKITPADISD